MIKLLGSNKYLHGNTVISAKTDIYWLHKATHLFEDLTPGKHMIGETEVSIIKTECPEWVLYINEKLEGANITGVCRDVGVHRSSLYRWMDGSRVPSTFESAKLAKEISKHNKIKLKTVVFDMAVCILGEEGGTKK